MKEKLKPCRHCKCSNIILDSFEAEENLPPTEIVYCDHCGMSTPEMERGRAVELWNIESDDKETVEEGEAGPSPEIAHLKDQLSGACAVIDNLYKTLEVTKYHTELAGTEEEQENIYDAMEGAFVFLKTNPVVYKRIN